MFKKIYKAIPTVHDKTGKKGWKIVDQRGRHFQTPTEELNGNYVVYFNYFDAQEMCDHLNGNSIIWKSMTQRSYETLKSMFANVYGRKND